MLICSPRPPSLPSFPFKSIRIIESFSLLFFSFFIGFSESLLCYDSSFPSPHSTQECGDGMMCYQEYYAIDRGDDRVDQYFERFCVAKRECHLRGFHGICTNFESFDAAIKETFETFRLRTKGFNRTALAHSKFCCCDTPLCNSFDVSAARLEFQLTSTTSNIMRQWLLVLPISLLFLL